MQVVSGFVFNSKIEVDTNAELGWFKEEEVKNEPMLFNCDREHARKFGGPITNTFLDKINPDWQASDIIVDSRVHMLMPGWYACIPGYHHDDIPRTRSDKQPDYVSPAYHAEHCMAMVNGEIAPTRFAIGKAFFQDVPIGSLYYKEWHPRVCEYVRQGILKTEYYDDIPGNFLVYFDWETWHEGTIAKKSGWRFFIRATRNTGRVPTNEIRRQVQVYLPNPMEGW